MTNEQKTHLYYILGRFEGTAFALEGEAQSALLDTCEMLSNFINEDEYKECVDSQDGK